MNYSKVDVHHHIIPEFYEEELKSIGITEVGGVKFPKWNVKKSLAVMTKNNIEKAILSISIPGVYFGDKEQSKNLARRCNEYIVELKDEYPSKFGGFASLPLPSVKDSVEEIKYGLDILNLDGVILMSSVDNIYLGDESYKEVFEELDKRKAVVFIHSNTPKEEFDSKLLNPFYWWFIDTTKTLMSIIKSGFHKDYPNIKYIVSHAGGVLPVVYDQLEKSLGDDNPNIQKELEDFKNRIYMDVAKSVGAETIDKLLEFTSVENVLFGSDYIWANGAKVKYWIDNVDKLENKGVDIRRIYNQNVDYLFDKNAKPTSLIIKSKSSVNKSCNTPNYHHHCNPEKIAKLVNQNGNEVASTCLESTKKTISNSKFKKTFLSLDIPEVWNLSYKKRRVILKAFNEEIRDITADENHLEGLGAIDIINSKDATEDIDYCIEHLGLKGIMIYLNISNTKLSEIFDMELLFKISKLDVPVIFHPVDANPSPVYNNKYLDTVYMVAKLFYLDHLEIFDNRNIVLTHTSGVHTFLAENIGMLYYLQLKKWKLGKFIIDQMIKKKPLGIETIKKIKFTD